MNPTIEFTPDTGFRCSGCNAEIPDSEAVWNQIRKARPGEFVELADGHAGRLEHKISGMSNLVWYCPEVHG